MYPDRPGRFWLALSLPHDQLWANRLIKWHFWFAHIGIVLYAVALWIAGIGLGYMWLKEDSNGSLSYSFVEAMNFSAPWMLVRFIGGALFVLGIVFELFNKCLK